MEERLEVQRQPVLLNLHIEIRINQGVVLHLRKIVFTVPCRTDILDTAADADTFDILERERQLILYE